MEIGERQSIQRRGTRLILIVVMGVLLALNASLGAAAVPGDVTAKFSAEAQSEGLTAAQASALQAEVEAEIADFGGEQIAPNKVRLGKGVTLTVVVPGEKYVRALSQPVGVRAACQHLYFCAYPGTNFTGNEISMFDCRGYQIPWVGNGSWDNNQSTGTRARMYGSGGALIYTTPGARSYDLVGSWTSIYSVRPC